MQSTLTAIQANHTLSKYSILVTLGLNFADPPNYIRCHGGDVYYVFGNILRSGKQLRDDVDLPFSQFITDSLSAFARTHNPNPTVSYLRTRNYLSTLAQIQSPGGIWQPVTAAADPLRRLAWPSEQAPFNDIAQCKQLGIPLEFLA